MQEGLPVGPMASPTVNSYPVCRSSYPSTLAVILMPCPVVVVMVVVEAVGWWWRRRRSSSDAGEPMATREVLPP